MKRYQYLKTAQCAGLAVAMTLGSMDSASAAGKVVSDPVTASEWTSVPGPNLLSAPAHETPAFSGEVTGVAASVVTVDGAIPAGSLDAFDFGSGVVKAQYVLIVRHDKTGDGPGTQGDWWPVAANTATDITVDTSGKSGAIGTRVEVGDIVEVYELISLKDLFKAGPDLIITPDSTFTGDGDSFSILDGLSFTGSIIYHDGSALPEAYYLDFFLSLGDGDKYTFLPDEPFYFNRDVGGSIDVTLEGVLQAYKLTHYITPGTTAVSTGYAVDSPVGESGLVESGFVADVDFTGGGDSIDTASGLSFVNNLIYHDGDALPSGLPTGWYVDFFSQNDAFPLASGTGFFLNAAGTFEWRQAPPVNY